MDPRVAFLTAGLDEACAPVTTQTRPLRKPWPRPSSAGHPYAAPSKTATATANASTWQPKPVYLQKPTSKSWKQGFSYPNSRGSQKSGLETETEPETPEPIPDCSDAADPRVQSLWGETFQTQNHQTPTLRPGKKAHKNAIQQLTFLPPRQPGYALSFFLATDINMMDLPKTTPEWDKNLEAKVVGIATLITYDSAAGASDQSHPVPELRVFASPELQALDPSLQWNGWIAEFGELMDGALGISCFNEASQYAVLRKHLPAEQRMLFWRLITFDLCTLLKKKTKQWSISLRDLLTANGLSNYSTHATAAAQFFENGDAAGVLTNVTDQVNAIEALRVLVRNSPTHSLKYAVKKSGNFVRNDSVSLSHAFVKTFLHPASVHLYINDRGQEENQVVEMTEEKPLFTEQHISSDPLCEHSTQRNVERFKEVVDC